MSKRVTVAFALAVGLAVLVAAGCGGSSRNKAYANDKAAYAAAMNSICAKFNAEQKAIGSPTNLSEAADKIPQLKKPFQEAIKTMESLQPPDELKKPAAEFIATGKALEKKLDDLANAAKANDQAEFNKIAAEGDTLNKQGDAAANEIGAPACLSTAS